ncbi:unnamed protein product, partial [Symbiodinium sp. KB8]
ACDKSHAKRYPTETDAAKSTTGPEKKWFEVSGTSLEPGDKSSMVRHQREVLSYPDVQMQSVKACAGRARKPVALCCFFWSLGPGKLQNAPGPHQVGTNVADAVDTANIGD